MSNLSRSSRGNGNHGAICSIDHGMVYKLSQGTNVKMEGNEYYEAIHAELSKKYGVENLTAAMMVVWNVVSVIIKN